MPLKVRSMVGLISLFADETFNRNSAKVPGVTERLYLVIESLQKLHHYYGDDFKVECPTGSGRYRTIDDVATGLATRLTRIFLRNADGERPVFGDNRRLQDDSNFRDHMLFHEYFHGDTGRGVGASHQTGWTGLVAKRLQPRRKEASAAREAGLALTAELGVLSVQR